MQERSDQRWLSSHSALAVVLRMSKRSVRSLHLQVECLRPCERNALKPIDTALSELTAMLRLPMDSALLCREKGRRPLLRPTCTGSEDPRALGIMADDCAA